MRVYTGGGGGCWGGGGGSSTFPTQLWKTKMKINRGYSPFDFGHFGDARCDSKLKVFLPTNGHSVLLKYFLTKAERGIRTVDAIKGTKTTDGRYQLSKSTNILVINPLQGLIISKSIKYFPCGCFALSLVQKSQSTKIYAKIVLLCSIRFDTCSEFFWAFNGIPIRNNESSIYYLTCVSDTFFSQSQQVSAFQCHDLKFFKTNHSLFLL